MFFLTLSKYKNIRIVLTLKYIIFITNNGILKFQTNFYNFLFYNNNLYFNCINYDNVQNNLELFYIQNLQYTFKYFQNFNKYLNYKYIYFVNFFNNFHYLIHTYTVIVNLKGIGYKFLLENNILKLRIGYSHFVICPLNKYIYIQLKSPTCLVLYSVNKIELTKFTAFLRSIRQPNLYKGTGIFFENEIILLKKKNLNKTKNAK
jgi:large subunit ribosomal protein L6